MLKATYSYNLIIYTIYQSKGYLGFWFKLTNVPEMHNNLQVKSNDLNLWMHMSNGLLFQNLLQCCP